MVVRLGSASLRQSATLRPIADIAADYALPADDLDLYGRYKAKVHLDVQFTRYRVDNSVIGSYRSLWIVTDSGGRWAVAARSSFAD